MKTKWQLEIYPKEQKITKKGTFEDYVGMYLRYKGKVNKVMAGYNVDTINSAGKERESFKITTRDYQWKFNYPMQGHCLWTQEDSLSQF